jgi:hypothetical protein
LFRPKAREFDIHRGTGEGDMVDSSGDAGAVNILTPYFDVVRIHERHAAGVSRARRHDAGTIANGV